MRYTLKYILFYILICILTLWIITNELYLSSFDLNHDQTINCWDVVELDECIYNNAEDLTYDLNRDGLVNQADLEFMKEAIGYDD